MWRSHHPGWGWETSRFITPGDRARQESGRVLEEDHGAPVRKPAPGWRSAKHCISPGADVAGTGLHIKCLFPVRSPTVRGRSGWRLVPLPLTLPLPSPLSGRLLQRNRGPVYHTLQGAPETASQAALSGTRTGRSGGWRDASRVACATPTSQVFSGLNTISISVDETKPSGT